MNILDWEKIGKTFFTAAFAICVIIGIHGIVHIAYNEKNDNITDSSSNSRFEIIETGNIKTNTQYIRYTIVYDKQTKVIYSIDSNRKFTALIDENGDPLIYNDKYIE